MPAVAQLIMIEALINKHWGRQVSQVLSCKFYKLIQPDQHIQIALMHTSTGQIKFKISNDGQVFSSGMLSLTRDSK